jgi:hypothetical protein
MRLATDDPAKNKAMREIEELASRPRRAPRRRCKCGECRNCQDDARWERIFQEKFADPYYYKREVVRFDSPLSSFPNS